MPFIHDVACTGEITEPRYIAGRYVNAQIPYVFYDTEEEAKAFSNRSPDRVYNYRYWGKPALSSCLIIDRRSNK